jgi:hypothetical protein
MTDQQGERLIAAFERIASALEFFVAGPEPPAPSTSCTHPPEARQSFGMTSGQEDWQCRLCGYRSLPE